MKTIFILFFVLFLNAYGDYRTKVFDLSDGALLGKGTFNNVSLDENGELYLSQYVSKVAGISTTMSWRLYSNPKEWFVGAENASFYRIDKKTKVVKKVSLGDGGGDVIAMHFVGDVLYVATSNPSALYKVSLKSEKVEKMMDLDVKYVWDMTSIGDSLYLATGGTGKVVKFDLKTRQGEDFFNKNDENIVKLKERGGSLYAATTKAGLLYKIEPSGEDKVIYNFEDLDIVDFTFDGDTLYVATTGLDEKKKTFSSIFSLENNKIQSIYKTDDSLSALSSRKAYLTFSTFNKKETFFYKYSKREKKTELLLRLGQKKSNFITNIVNDEKRSMFLTSSGEVYEHKEILNSEGEYLSDALDAASIATWGKITYSSDDAKVFKIYTQGAMSLFQDESFEKWREVKEDGSISSDASRYLRLKIVFKSRSSSKESLKKIRDIKVYYATNDNEVKIKNFFITRDEKLFQKLHVDYSYEGLLLFWDIENNSGDSDALTYKIFFKERNEKDWGELTKRLFKSNYILNRFLLPEGVYDFKATVFDGTANEVDHTELKDVVIDNTPPKTKFLYEQSNLISFQAIDERGLIKKLSYSFDPSAEYFYDAVPVDKVFDSPLETFLIERPDKVKSKKLYLYVEDESGNYSYQIISLGPFKH